MPSHEGKHRFPPSPHPRARRPTIDRDSFSDPPPLPDRAAEWGRRTIEPQMLSPPAVRRVVERIKSPENSELSQSYGRSTSSQSQKFKPVKTQPKPRQPSQPTREAPPVPKESATESEAAASNEPAVQNEAVLRSDPPASVGNAAHGGSIAHGGSAVRKGAAVAKNPKISIEPTLSKELAVTSEPAVRDEPAFHKKFIVSKEPTVHGEPTTAKEAAAHNGEKVLDAATKGTEPTSVVPSEKKSMVSQGLTYKPPTRKVLQQKDFTKFTSGGSLQKVSQPLDDKPKSPSEQSNSVITKASTIILKRRTSVHQRRLVSNAIKNRRRLFDSQSKNSSVGYITDPKAPAVPKVPEVHQAKTKLQPDVHTRDKDVANVIDQSLVPGESHLGKSTRKGGDNSAAPSTLHTITPEDLTSPTEVRPILGSVQKWRSKSQEGLNQGEARSEVKENLLPLYRTVTFEGEKIPELNPQSEVSGRLPRRHTIIRKPIATETRTSSSVDGVPQGVTKSDISTNAHLERQLPAKFVIPRKPVGRPPISTLVPGAEAKSHTEKAVNKAQADSSKTQSEPGWFTLSESLKTSEPEEAPIQKVPFPRNRHERKPRTIFYSIPSASKQTRKPVTSTTGFKGSTSRPQDVTDESLKATTGKPTDRFTEPKGKTGLVSSKPGSNIERVRRKTNTREFREALKEFIRTRPNIDHAAHPAFKGSPVPSRPALGWNRIRIPERMPDIPFADLDSNSEPEETDMSLNNPPARMRTPKPRKASPPPILSKFSSDSSLRSDPSTPTRQIRQAPPVPGEVPGEFPQTPASRIGPYASSSPTPLSVSIIPSSHELPPLPPPPSKLPIPPPFTPRGKSNGRRPPPISTSKLRESSKEHKPRKQRDTSKGRASAQEDGSPKAPKPRNIPPIPATPPYKPLVKGNSWSEEAHYKWAKATGTPVSASSSRSTSMIGSNGRMSLVGRASEEASLNNSFEVPAPDSHSSVFGSYWEESESSSLNEIIDPAVRFDSAAAKESSEKDKSSKIQSTKSLQKLRKQRSKVIERETMESPLMGKGAKNVSSKSLLLERAPTPDVKKNALSLLRSKSSRNLALSPPPDLSDSDATIKGAAAAGPSRPQLKKQRSASRLTTYVEKGMRKVRSLSSIRDAAAPDPSEIPNIHKILKDAPPEVHAAILASKDDDLGELLRHDDMATLVRDEHIPILLDDHNPTKLPLRREQALACIKEIEREVKKAKTLGQDLDKERLRYEKEDMNANKAYQKISTQNMADLQRITRTKTRLEGWYIEDKVNSELKAEREAKEIAALVQSQKEKEKGKRRIGFLRSKTPDEENAAGPSRRRSDQNETERVPSRMSEVAAPIHEEAPKGLYRRREQNKTEEDVAGPSRRSNQNTKTERVPIRLSEAKSTAPNDGFDNQLRPAETSIISLKETAMLSHTESEVKSEMDRVTSEGGTSGSGSKAKADKSWMKRAIGMSRPSVKNLFRRHQDEGEE